MSLQQLRKKTEGFTIIEVLIVLAIAGLILLIVFLAVPALQRNSRNTQRSNDVSVIGGAISEYSNNHNGAMPGAKADWQANAKLGFYDIATTEVTYTKQTTAGTTSPVTEAGNVVVETFRKCHATNGSAIGTGASSRTVVALFAVETGGGTPASRCQEL